MPNQGFILLADRDARTTPVMDLALHHLELPYQLASVPNGQEVIRYLQNEGRYEDAFPFPKLLLLDLGIKRVDAFAVLRWIRKAPAARHLTVVVLAQSTFDSDIARAYASGANSFLVKAYGFKAILEQLREIDEQWLRPRPPASKKLARKRNRKASAGLRNERPAEVVGVDSAGAGAQAGG
jgi:CheY-like chemotaxis protein